DVTFIDAAGKGLLSRISDQGAKLKAVGCMTRSIVEEITRGLKMKKCLLVAILTIGLILGSTYSKDVMASEPTDADPPKAPATIALSLEDAIQLSIKNNLETQLAGERKEEARGRAMESRSALLPNLSAGASQASETLNLASLGFAGNIPQFGSPFKGPFDTFD